MKEIIFQVKRKGSGGKEEMFNDCIDCECNEIFIRFVVLVSWYHNTSK